MPKRSASAMLDCQDGQKEGDNCTHCHTESGDCRLYWGIQLDQDLLETIVGIYPEWFKDCNNSGNSSSNNSNNSMNLAVTRGSNGIEPKTIKPTIIPLSSNNDENPSLQKTLEKNKESLKVKLMLRRPINELIERGILPPLKSSAFHEQRQKMERVKMGDILNGKIQTRPDRQVFLQQQHMPEGKEAETSLQEQKQKQKKARFLDTSLVSEHSGSLKLIKGNILEADEVLAQAVREGCINFQNLTDDSLSLLKIVKEENDTGSDGTSPSPPYNFSEHSQESFPSLDTSDMSPIPLTNVGSPSSARTSFSVSPSSSGSSPLSLMPCVVSSPPRPDQLQHQDFILNGLMLQNKDSPVKGNRKKAKPKSQPKARTIKFHEYKGPPNAQKNTQSAATNATSNSSATETSYDLLLQQQQLFLQWQLEWQQKYPQSVVPQGPQVPSSPSVAKGDQSAQSNHVPVSSICSPLPQLESPPSPQKVITKLEDLKVSDLKVELKKRNLPVSGPKPILIERLKTYAESNKSLPLPGASMSSGLPSSSITTTTSSPDPTDVAGGILMDTLSSIPTASANDISDIFDLPTVANSDLTTDIYCSLESADNQSSATVVITPSACSVPMDVDSTQMCTDVEPVVEPATALLTNEAIVQLQQRCIEKLQMELQKSQMQLHHNICQPQEPTNVPPGVLEDRVATSTGTDVLMNTPSTSITSSTTEACATVSIPANTAVETVDPVESKLRQRQLIHQQLQQKIHQQIQHLQQQRTKKQAKSNEVANKPSGANSTLTALLESDPISSPLDISINSVPDVRKSIESSSPYRMDTFGQLKNVDGDLAPLFMNSPPVSSISPNHPSSSTTETLSTSTKSNTPAHRTSSLPSFSAFVNKKPLATRSNTDPLFHISKPPPNYSEATRQLNKMKQQMLQANEFGSNSSRQPKKHKASVKSQAVDDVLEILIKNGELPPSAAQEPQTSRTPINPKRDHLSPPLFQTAVANGLCSTNVVPLVSPTVSPCERDPQQQHNVNLHMSSLQSVLDMTPPSSAGFGETNSHTPSSLDFDFHLDMEDIEVMDLETLPHQEHHIIDRQLSADIGKVHRTTNSLDAGQELPLLNRESMSCTNKNMDADILEWLELLDDSAKLTFTGVEHLYHTTNEHDPMLSNIGNGHDSMDIFGVDDMEFKTNEVSILSWDKSDFGT